MAHDKNKGVSRREVIAGAAAATLVATTGHTAEGAHMRMPVAYIPHGGGPWPFVDVGIPRDEHAQLAGYLQELAALPAAKPRALLVISAHWEADVPTVMSSPRPPMLYDYYGFPPESYALQWPAPGEPTLAEHVRELLTGAGIANASDDARGFDHGTFVPLMLTYPDAEIPTVQLSLKAGLDPHFHIELGRALAPLRDEGVFIIGSGMSFHNLRAMRDRSLGAFSGPFDAWLQETVTASSRERDDRLRNWASAPGARAAHPREEHLVPLHVVAGAAGEDVGRVGWSGTVLGWRVSAAHFG